MIGRAGGELSLNDARKRSIISRMSYADAVARIQAIESLAAPPAQASAPTAASPASFAAALADASTVSSIAATTPTGGRLVAVAQAEVGQAEDPPGSNDGPRIADYRSAVQGAVAGEPWCADFVSWVAAEAGVPLGDQGAGFASVAALTAWAGRTGRLLPAGAPARPGDLVLFGDRHVGLVEAVEPDGTLDTIEGNEGDAVTRVRRSPGEWTGLVRLG
jgi:CHAP domain